jgi:hypothetical protein
MTDDLEYFARRIARNGCDPNDYYYLGDLTEEEKIWLRKRSLEILHEKEDVPRTIPN